MFLVVSERTPPLLHNFYQVEKISKQGNGQWAIELTVEDPKQL